MPKPALREPYAHQEHEIIETLIAGLHEWRPDLRYPESGSDMQGCVRALFRMYEMKRRPIALRVEQIIHPDYLPEDSDDRR